MTGIGRPIRQLAAYVVEKLLFPAPSILQENQFVAENQP
jgi:hypothetical protein